MWKKLSDRTEVDLKTYVADYIAKYPETAIGISTDSINRGMNTWYATVVVLYRKGKGGHVLFSRRKNTRKLFGNASQKDFMKLYNETIYTQEVVDLLDEYHNIMDVHLDFNLDKNYFSNQVLLASMGYFQGKGIRVKGKPGEYAQVADKVVRGGN